ncbi:unnamed protein product, partial [Linum tenue]
MMNGVLFLFRWVGSISFWEPAERLIGNSWMKLCVANDNLKLDFLLQGTRKSRLLNNHIDL